jgi:hypothetical protein
MLSRQQLGFSLILSFNSQTVKSHLLLLAYSGTLTWIPNTHMLVALW